MVEINAMNTEEPLKNKYIYQNLFGTLYSNLIVIMI